MFRNFLLLILLLATTSCSWAHARMTYDFQAFSGDQRVFFEPGAEDLAKLVVENLEASLSTVEEHQFVPFKNRSSIKVYIFNDKKRYSRFSFASVHSRGSATANEIYLSPKIREKIKSLAKILTHELSHVHIRQYTGGFKYVSNLTGWFLEGIAVNASSGGGAGKVSTEESRAAFKSGVHFRPSTSGSLFGHKTASDFGLKPHMYYRQASQFVEYLKSSNPKAFKKTFIEFLHNEKFNEAWETNYGITLDQLWSKFLRGQA